MNTKTNHFSTSPHGAPRGSLIRRAPIVLAAAWPLLANAQNDVPKWSVHEITLTAAAAWQSLTPINAPSPIHQPDGGPL